MTLCHAILFILQKKNDRILPPAKKLSDQEIREIVAAAHTLLVHLSNWEFFVT